MGVLPIYSQGAGRSTDTIAFDYCIICSGCNFNPFSPIGESLWFPTVHEQNREKSEWGHIDERLIEGRRRHILEEYHKIAELAKKNSTMMIAGAGFIGVEWATELEYYFPNLKMTIIDFLPRCLGPLPDGAADYCSEYMSCVGIKEFYSLKYEPKNPEFWAKVELPNGVDYCIICAGCNFNPFSPIGESLWFPTVHADNRAKSEWGHIDERFIEGRRRHILEEYHKIAELAKKNATIMIAGAGFIGVEWATELEYYFPNLKVTIIDFLPRCLGPLPDGAADYCSEYMSCVGIKEFYSLKYEPKNPEFWAKVELPNGADFTYVFFDYCIICAGCNF